MLCHRFSSFLKELFHFFFNSTMRLRVYWIHFGRYRRIDPLYINHLFLFFWYSLKSNVISFRLICIWTVKCSWDLITWCVSRSNNRLYLSKIVQPKQFDKRPITPAASYKVNVWIWKNIIGNGPRNSKRGNRQTIAAPNMTAIVFASFRSVLNRSNVLLTQGWMAWIGTFLSLC